MMVFVLFVSCVKFFGGEWNSIIFSYLIIEICYEGICEFFEKNQFFIDRILLYGFYYLWRYLFLVGKCLFCNLICSVRFRVQGLGFCLDIDVIEVNMYFDVYLSFIENVLLFYLMVLIIQFCE